MGGGGGVLGGGVGQKILDQESWGKYTAYQGGTYEALEESLLGMTFTERNTTVG